MHESKHYGNGRIMKSPPGSTDKVIDVKVKERVKRGVKAFIDRLGLEWFLEGGNHSPSFKVKTDVPFMHLRRP